MTHDELLDKVNQGELGWFYGWMQDALRAVVELHKPNGDECLVCEKDNDGDWGWEIYPCPTIQAIEKELG